MRILVVSDSSEKSIIGQKLEEQLLKKLRENNYDYKHYNVAGEEMKKCVGCFNCWTSTPGICVFEDITRDICRDSANSDIYVILSEIKYGGWSTQIKRILDRSIGNILPFFKTVKGEMHHAPRYASYPQLCFLGYGSGITDEEEETFRAVGQANAINFQIEKAETCVCRDQEEAGAAVENLINYFKRKGGEK